MVITPASGTISLTALAPEQQVGSANILDLLWAGGAGCSISYLSNSGLNQAIVLTGQGSSGAASDTESTPGLVTYTLQCDSSTTTVTTTINWVATPTPSILSAASSSWVANESYPLAWNSSSGPCVASGGAQGDGWAGSKALSGTQSIAESQQGTYVFTLVCGSTTSQVAVTVPTPFIQIYAGGGGTIDSPYLQGPIQWQSTVAPCTYVDGSASATGGVTVPASGSATPTSTTPGVYLFSLTCGSGANPLYAATFALVVPEVSTTLSASVATAPVDGPVTLTWNSNGSYPCYASGGTGQPPWTGTLGGSGSGSLIVTSASAGTVTYGINCGNQTASATVTYAAVAATSANAPTPTVSFSAIAATQTAGQSVSLTWSSTNTDACTPSGGEAGDGWSGTLATSGSMSVTETSAGTVTYSITCTGAPPAASATTTVVIKSSATSTGGSTNSHGGGGTIDLLLVLGLTLTLLPRIMVLRFTDEIVGAS